MNNKEQIAKVKKFVSDWTGKGSERADSQTFWLDLLENVLGVESPKDIIDFEWAIKNGYNNNTNFIDGFITKTKILIEQKSINKDLRKGIKQSDGSILTPFQQAKRYIVDLSVSHHPRFVVTCNFKEFLIYDMEKPNGEPQSVLLENLVKESYRLRFIVDSEDEHIVKETEVSIKAGELVGKIYDLLIKQYKDPSNPETLASLNMFCVRIVFCLYAEDSGIFGKHGMFHDYLKAFSTKDVRKAIIDLFKILDQKPEERDQYEAENLLAFPYVNGGLFADKNIEIPQLTDEIVSLILRNASEDFDWSEISPTIFGAVFESTLNPETRHDGGMHYTSIENIHKVIDNLFLNELYAEFNSILELKQEKLKKSRLYEFQEKLANLTFLDPACGSGNFLTQTYISLRKLENKIITAIEKDQISIDTGSIIKVKISQFYGIEINSFATTVGKTALWIAESQMLKQTEDIVDVNIEFLPLKSYANIVCANALTTDWQDVVPNDKLSYIMGNPPFLGARVMSKEQKHHIEKIFEGAKGYGNLDFVCGWYIKASEYIKGTSIDVAFVSTNSITQGEQTSLLWKPMIENGVSINFAYRTFKWTSEASDKAAVHCVIIGFSNRLNSKSKYLYISDKNIVDCKNINPYLVDAPNILVENRTNPLCNVPSIGIGNKPIDGGNYLFTETEMKEFISKEPLSEKWFRPWLGAKEFINNYYRYCLWLGECPPNELNRMKYSLERVKAVREYRLLSPSAGTRKIADTPTRFHVENIPKSDYLLVPRVSSESRKYIPIGFISSEVIASDSVSVVPNATLYEFGVMTSNVHMAWVRTVCGRLKSDYRYSGTIVYNNFPWCNPTTEQKTKIEQTAQAILDARALYPECSLADLYNELTMPKELRKAHQNNDKAVMNAYGFPVKSDFTEAMCVAELMTMYKELINSTSK